MITHAFFRPFGLVWLAVLLLAIFPFTPRVMSQAPPPGPADQAAQQALELFNAGKNPEAIAAYEAIIKNFPTAGVVSEAQFRLGYLRYLTGEHDRSIETLKKILAPPAPPDIQELAHNLLPQVMSAKAAKLKPGDPARVKAFKEAIAQFDTFIQKFPASDEVISANYGRALASYQIEDYEGAAKTLRDNLSKFAQHESVLDSQYLLALTLLTEANALAREDKKDQAFPKYTEAATLLGDIIRKGTDIVLANDSQFQIGEVLSNRAPFEDEAARKQTLAQALAAYSAVQPKEEMIKAQEARINGILQRQKEVLAARDMKGFKRLQSLQGREREKLETMKEKEGQSMLAKLRVAGIYFQQQRFDEARAILRYLVAFLESPELQKQYFYYLTLTYASQAIADKAVEAYNNFQAKYKGDPMGENLPVVIGSMFLGPNPKAHDPVKAIQYFQEAMTIYPKSQYAKLILPQQASALVELKQFDKALDIFKKFLTTNPAKDLAAVAEFGMAVIQQQTNKVEDAIKGFITVRDKYGDTPQGQQSSFYVGHLLVQKGDAKGAIPELKNFMAKYPQDPLVPTALYEMAQSQAATGDKAGALASYEKLGTDYPKSETAPFSYFQRSSLYMSEQKTAEMEKTMRDFLAAYPENPNIIVAYDTIAQNQIAQQKPLEAIATYREMVDKHGDHPKAADAFVKIANLWYTYAQKQGPYLALNEAQRVEWKKGVDGAVEAAEQLLTKFPESDQVALGLQQLLGAQKLLVGAKLKTDADTEKYFQDFADKFAEHPGTRSKVLFTLAAFTYEKDKAKAVAQMTAAFDPKLKYAPADLDLYGSALIEQKKLEEAAKAYAKLAADYPIPAGSAPNQAPEQVQEAQAIALYGAGKVLQLQGKIAEAGAKFDTLKKEYPRSPKILEANYGIALALLDQKKYDDAIALVGGIVRAPTVTADLRASAFLLIGRANEGKGEIAPAIDNFLKIPVFFSASPIAPEGLWRGGQLLEQQAGTLNETTKPKRSEQIAKAVKAYKDIVEKYPASSFVAKASERLAAIAPGK